jgi:TolB protein
MASCYTRSGATRLYAVPVDGSAPTAITAKHGTHSADLGDLDARSLSGTTYLEASGPCGVVFLARQHSTGTATEVHVPGSTGNVYLLGTQGHRLVIQTGISCDGGPSHDAIAHFDPTTGADRVVARLPLGEAYNTVLAFGERRTTFG